MFCPCLMQPRAGVSLLGCLPGPSWCSHFKPKVWKLESNMSQAMGSCVLFYKGQYYRFSGYLFHIRNMLLCFLFTKTELCSFFFFLLCFLQMERKTKSRASVSAALQIADADKAGCRNLSSD